MDKIVKGLRSLGYRLVVSNLSDEEKAVWENMVASAISQQVSTNLLPEEKAEWDKMVSSESCSVCWLYGEDLCSSHN